MAKRFGVKPDDPAEPPGNVLGEWYATVLNLSTFRLVVWRRTIETEVWDLVKSMPPAFFEKLVVQLLVAMGYGGSLKDAGQAVGKSGDGGIDGIIKEDKLGLDGIHVQAKRWQGTVGRPEIQSFAGSLDGVKAKKGIFITTSSFSPEAKVRGENREAHRPHRR